LRQLGKVDGGIGGRGHEAMTGDMEPGGTQDLMNDRRQAGGAG